MKYSIGRFALIIMSVMAMAAGARAADDKASISGKAYLEYTYPVFPDSLTHADSLVQFHFTRFYFNYETKISKLHSVRFRLDGDDQADGKKWRPYLKHAYVAWHDIIPGATAYFGLQGTPNWSYSEKFWGYRSVEKTIMDLNKIGSSADLGVGIKGQLPWGFAYHLLYANGSGYSQPEDDDSKKGYALLGLAPVKELTSSAFVDYEYKTAEDIRLTYGAFGGIDFSWIKLGGEYFQRKEGPTGKTVTQTGISVFGRLSWKVYGYLGNVIGRLDIYDPDASLVNNEATYAIICYDFRASKKFHIVPNFRRGWSGNWQKMENPVDIVYVTFEFSY